MNTPAILLALLFVCGLTQTAAADDSSPLYEALPAPVPFASMPEVLPHLHAPTGVSVTPWQNGTAPIGHYDPEFFDRIRYGTVTVNKNTPTYVDFISNKHDMRAYYELVNSNNGHTLLKIDALNDPDGAQMYFSGDGTVYIRQIHPFLCGPRFTRKFVLHGNRFIEQAQPLHYIGAETPVEEDTQLYASPTSTTVVTTLKRGSQALVIGLLPGTSRQTMALLLRSADGLTGWHVPERQYPRRGVISIYQCN